jgi:small subunit ribosomal protein S8
MTDPIADMIIRIKNALLAHHAEVVIPHSNMKHAIGQILHKEGYVADVAIKNEGPQPSLILKLKYSGKVPTITDVRRLSKPGRRLYASAHKIPRTLGGYGITIISTSKGVITDKEARQQNVGGELLCQIW